MPFWAGYCQYWEDMLKADAERDVEPFAPKLELVQRKRTDA